MEIAVKTIQDSADADPVAAAPPAAPFRLGYQPALDGIRGISITIVLVFHANERLLPGGFLGVDLFFVLSGFLITSLLVQEFDATGGISLKSFYMRRVLRLFPALFTMLLLFCAAAILVFGFHGAVDHLIDSAITVFYTANWARALGVHRVDFLGHAWSLSLEEQFYLIWPPMLLLLLRVMRSRWLVAFLPLGLALASWALRFDMHIDGATLMRVLNGLDTHADGLMIGCCAGLAVASGLLSDKAKRALARGVRFLSPISLLLLCYLVLFKHWYDLDTVQWWLFCVPVLGLILILDCVLGDRRDSFHRIFSNRLLVRIGMISYGLYLWHYPIYRFMASAFGMGWVTVLVFGTILTFLVAILSYRLVETPFLRLKRKFQPSPA